MKFTGNKLVFTAIVFFFAALVAAPFIIILTTKPHAIEAKQVDLPPWKNLGAVSSGYQSATVLRRQDPDTNATIYVTLSNQGVSLFVLPAEKSK